MALYDARLCITFRWWSVYAFFLKLWMVMMPSTLLLGDERHVDDRLRHLRHRPVLERTALLIERADVLCRTRPANR